jgi:hypothetical protein
MNFGSFIMKNAILLAAALLAACGQSNDDKPGNVAATDAMTKEDVAAVIDTVKMRPGQWESSYTLEDIAMPNMPAGAPVEQIEQQMKATMSRASIRHCVTPQQAEKPSGDMFSGQKDKDCTYKGFAMGRGAMKGQVSCKKDGTVMNATMSGTYGSDRYDIGMDMAMSGAAQGQTMTMKARTSGKWLGAECKDAGPGAK